ncbi:MAG: hypothetical protein HY914_08285 [Desulfomonile tiedjei]|nr:hypothetical protein [Desulfomonile tiedjei]
MGSSDEKENDTQKDRCSCGALLEKSEFDAESGELICPSCGAVMAEDEIDVSGDDTEMLNVGEMARMAQEGVDPSISGEWDTSGATLHKLTRRRKK